MRFCLYYKIYIDIIAIQRLNVNEKNFNLYFEMILRTCNEDTKFVYKLYCKIYIDIRMTQKSNVNEKNSNLYSKISIKFIIKI